ncbi:MAG: SPOR domain-containing protein [Rhodocyclaceae bacterium]|nr:SPOR domain-containing protein [Rhodocyclaceae bacterium]
MAQPETELSAEAQIDLQKRARRRLVGATALALLAAVVLPMVMDHEPKPQLQDIQIRIPSREKVEQPGREEASFTSKILPSEPLPTPLPPVEVADISPAQTAVPAAQAAVSAAPEEKPVPVAVTKPAPVVAKPLPAVKPAPPPSEPEWSVQLGAYKDAANVKQLLFKIKELGLPAYTEPFDSPLGARTRVRAGPFASQEVAQQAQTRLKVISLNGPVAKK